MRTATRPDSWIAGTLFVITAWSMPVSAQVVSFGAASGAPRDYPVGLSPQGVATGDFNGDLIADLALANRGSNTVSVLLGNGNGTFQAAASFAVDSLPVSVVAADLDGDGDQDLVTTNYGPGTVSVLKGNGNGTFQAAVTYPAGGDNPNFAAAGDFDGDGDPDLAVAIFGGNTPTATTVAILRGNGDGTLQAPVALTAQRAPLWVTVADLNADTFADVVSANYGADSVSVFLGNGDGTFQAALNFPAGSFACSVTVADFNKDGKPDLAVADYGDSGNGNLVSVLLGNGNGTFGAPAVNVVGIGPTGIWTADFNGDTNPDLAVANWDHNAGTVVSILVGNGDGTFVPSQNIAAGAGVVAGTSGDFTGDGLSDFATANFNAGTTSVLINGTSSPTTHTLQVSKAGTGAGTVTSSPSGIDCGATCSASYNAGTLVTLSANANAGSTFTGWGGACSGTGPCTVVMSSNNSVTATFTLQQQTFTLSVSKNGTGSGTVTSNPAGVSCGSDCSESYNSGTVVTLTAAPAGGSTFTGWSGACSGTGACNVTMSAARSVTASFTLQQFTLTVTKEGLGLGTVTSSPAGINCGSDCSETYNSGSVITLTASPGLLSAFDGWVGGGCSGTGSCTVTIDAAKTVTARFRLLGLL